MATHSQKQLDYIKQYEKANTRQYKLRFHKVNDLQIIEHLDKQPNRNGYIRQLILKDMGGV